MRTIYLDRGTRLKSFKANVSSSSKATVDIKVEISGHRELGFFLNELAEIEAAQKAALKAERTASKRSATKALPAPLLQIPHFPGDET